ncbi:hypothetical protein F3Y22_tig00001825pilonHSYRG00124 [Hibiscus syriacus]|uniref:Uncharacterized protein n=1 Tax=Hibiscus syriacus TaxID=106335 RepID=A0A6A3CZG7_HIBSY|nr:hypothetical protein F3Y22_tig00001825pilonHSYRG00124 [Hibiscus syriacus]
MASGGVLTLQMSKPPQFWYKSGQWFTRKARNPYGYHRLTQAGSFYKSKTLSKFISWGRRLKNGAKSICSAQTGSSYIPIEVRPHRLLNPTFDPGDEPSSDEKTEPQRWSEEGLD